MSLAQPMSVQPAPPPHLTRQAMGAHIAQRLRQEQAALKPIWDSNPNIRYFYIDNVLPEEWASTIRAAYPDPSAMTFKESLRERKYIAAQMNKYNPVLEEII